jgi:hypothetical protein
MARRLRFSALAIGFAVRMSRRLGLMSALAAWLVCLSIANAAQVFAVPDDGDLSAAAAAVLQSAKVPAGATAEDANHLKEMTSRYPAVDFDPDARAAQLGPGIEPAFNYVRDHIRYESYPGAFRGADCAYRSRAGNAADRSILLARLLKAKGIETRFVMGQLPSDKAEALFQRIFDPIDANALPPAPLTEKRNIAARIGVRAARDYAAVRGALGQNLPAGGGIDHDAMLREISSHMWVQANVDGKWVDLDSAFADATPGKSYAPDGKPVDALPAEAFQQVTMRVIVERLDGGALKPETVLEITRPAIDLVDRQIFLLHGGLGAGGGVEGLQGGTQGIVPVISIDGQENQGKPINFDDAKSSGGGGGGGGALGGFGGFGGALGGGGGTAPTSQFVAEYLEFELNIPGGDRQVVRRTLIERAGAAWRLASSLDPKTLAALEKDDHGPLAAQTVHNIWFSGGPHNLASLASAMQGFTLVKGAAGGADAGAAGNAEQPDSSVQLWLLALKGLACLIPTDHWFLPALNDDPSARFYLDSPRILLFSLSTRPADADHVIVESETDWRRDHVRGVARDAAAGPAVAKRKIWYGLLEGALEHELAAQTGAALDAAPQTTIASTSASLGDAGLAIVRSTDAGGAWESLAQDRETAARMSAALKAGDLLVVPKQVLTGNGQPAWWAISPSNGDTRAVWGPDINASVARSPLPRPPGGRGGIYRVFPDGTSINLKKPIPKAREGAGDEYITVTYKTAIMTIIYVGDVATLVWVAYEIVRWVFF